MAIYNSRSGGRTPRAGESRSDYIPGRQPVGNNSSSKLDWLNKVGRVLNPVTDFLDGPDGVSHISSDGQDISQSLDIQSVIDRIKSSQLYIQAYRLFSSSPDYSLFLQRLEGILDSVNSNYQTWFDQVGFSNKYKDSLTEAYNYAIEQIQLLLKEFHEWTNSLPSTQVQQFADAGVNSAITGQGLTGSSLSGETARRSFVESTNPAEMLSSLSDIALNKIPGVVSTVAGVWKSIKDVRLAGRAQDLAERVQGFNEQSTVASIRKSLIEQGFSLGDQEWSTLADFHSWTNKISSDPKLSKMFKDSSVAQFFSDLSYNGIMSKVQSSPYSWTEDTFGQTFEEFYNDLGNFQLTLWKDTLQFKADKAKYDREYWNVRDGKLDGDLENIRRSHETFVKNFEKTQAEHKLFFLNKWIERAQNSKDPVAKFAVNQILFQDPTVALLDTGADLLYDIGSQFKESGLSPLDFFKSQFDK